MDIRINITICNLVSMGKSAPSDTWVKMGRPTTAFVLLQIVFFTDNCFFQFFNHLTETNERKKKVGVTSCIFFLK